MGVCFKSAKPSAFDLLKFLAVWLLLYTCSVDLSSATLLKEPVNKPLNPFWLVCGIWSWLFPLFLFETQRKGYENIGFPPLLWLVKAEVGGQGHTSFKRLPGSILTPQAARSRGRGSKEEERKLKNKIWWQCLKQEQEESPHSREIYLQYLHCTFLTNL